MNFIQKNSYLLVIIALCTIFTFIGLNKLEQEVQYKNILVEEGDTLWDYSVQYANNVPKDKWIAEIVRVNNLESTTIQVGDMLKVPNGMKKQVVATHIAGDEKEK